SKLYKFSYSYQKQENRKQTRNTSQVGRTEKNCKT
ncbi:hypothetical protein LINPERPRIM_LOCUS37581, partial [Linum perenne]